MPELDLRRELEKGTVTIGVRLGPVNGVDIAALGGGKLAETLDLGDRGTCVPAGPAAGVELFLISGKGPLNKFEGPGLACCCCCP